MAKLSRLRRLLKRNKHSVTCSRHYLDELFDSFTVKDMTRRGFQRAYKRIMDPKHMAREAEDIALQRYVNKTLRKF